MALNNFKCDHLMPLQFIGLTRVQKDSRVEMQDAPPWTVRIVTRRSAAYRQLQKSLVELHH